MRRKRKRNQNLNSFIDKSNVKNNFYSNDGNWEPIDDDENDLKKRKFTNVLNLHTFPNETTPSNPTQNIKNKIFNTFEEKEKKKLFEFQNKDDYFRIDFPLDDVLPIVPPINPKYFECLKKILEKRPLKLFKELVDSIYDENGNPSKPTLKDHMIDFVISKLFGIEWDNLKRSVEKTNIKYYEKRFFFEIFNKSVVLPEEIIAYILQYMTKNKSFLNGVGLVNELFYIQALKSWGIVRITKKNLYKIPLLVLTHAKIVKVTIKDFYLSDLIYFKKNIPRVVKLILCGNVLKFFNAVTRNKPKVSFEFLETLIIDNLTASEYFWNDDLKGKKKEFQFPPKKYYPKIQNLIIPCFNVPIVYNDFFLQLKYLRITTSFSKFGYSLPERQLEHIPAYWNNLPKLEGILFDSSINEEGLQLICNNVTIKRLMLQIHKKEDVDIINQVVYTKEFGSGLKEFKLDFKNTGFDEKAFKDIDYLSKIPTFLKGLKLIILEFHVRNLKNYIANLSLDHIEQLNSLPFDKIVIEFKSYTFSFGEKETNEEIIARWFCKLFKRKKIKFKKKIKLKYGNKIIHIIESAAEGNQIVVV